MTMLKRALFLLLFTGLGHGAAAQDSDAGEKLFRACKTCHQIGEGAKNRTGPHLNGVLGRAAGALEDFRYSKAMKTQAAEGLVWDAQTLDAFLADPKGTVPKTRMNFAGISDPQDRADLIAYIGLYSEATATATTLPEEILALEGDAEYGEYLAGECTTCHQAGGADDGIPSITGWPARDFVIAMHGYKSKERPHPVMQMVAGRLGNEEIAALAAYFEALE